MDHLWQASRGARDLTLECLTITGIDKNATTIPTAQTMVLTNDGATTYPSLRPIVTNPPVPNTSSHVLRISWIMGLSVDLQLDLWIRPCQELRSLVWEAPIFRTVGFGPLAFEALRRHFGTLKTLKWIGYAGSVTNEMAKEVLESCPLLEDFYAPFLWVSDFGTSAVVEEVQGR
ncbi:hypothetical protein BGZ95_006429 [Linnemannia exigua]|uniref:Uncharacterized protein n=1 Tax=Linnemannia exigua TaxID=604196 RepID=A0AAD4HCH0_9FUNG|nr:hypothetical protein BGZ95_006429 [Linnemannia exigua]